MKVSFQKQGNPATLVLDDEERLYQTRNLKQFANNYQDFVEDYDDSYYEDFYEEYCCDESYDEFLDEVQELADLDVDIDLKDRYSDSEEHVLFGCENPVNCINTVENSAPFFDKESVLFNQCQTHEDPIKMQGFYDTFVNAGRLPGEICDAAGVIADSSNEIGKTVKEIGITAKALNDFIVGTKKFPRKVGQKLVEKGVTIFKDFTKIADQLVHLNLPGAMGQALSSTASLIAFCVKNGFEYHREILFVCVGVGAVCLI